MTADVSSRLQNLPQLSTTDVPLSLYIHIPFCGRKCDYCDFFSVPSAPVSLQRRVVERILLDTSELHKRSGGPPIQSVYIGGGTPNSLEKGLLQKLLSGISEAAGAPQEWTMEVNPEFLTAGSLDQMAEAGVERLSMGVQSFSPEGLRRIGRRVTVSNIERAIELVASRWDGRWSLDVMTLLPVPERGTEKDGVRETALRDLKRALSYAPGHLSLYGLTAEPRTPLYERVLRGRDVMPDEEAAGDTLPEQWALLEREGYSHYEVSNFARGEDEKSLHNLRYWRLDPYLGVGPSAVSTLPGPSGPLRLRFLPGLRTYTGERGSRMEVEEISASEFLLEHLMTGLRTEEGMNLDRIRGIFGERAARTLHTRLGPKVASYEKSGFLVTYGKRRSGPTAAGDLPWTGFRATDRGFMLLDSILLDLSGELDRVDMERLRWP